MSFLKTKTSIASFVLVVFGAGCSSSSYIPGPGPRVAVTIKKDHGLVYIRDGTVYESGLSGAGLEDAVRGNARAEEHARAYKNNRIGGLVSLLVGSLALGTGVALVLNDDAARAAGQPGNSDQRVAGDIVLVGALCASLLSLTLAANAEAHRWDAINIYNDELVGGVPPNLSATPEIGSRAPTPASSPAPPATVTPSPTAAPPQ